MTNPGNTPDKVSGLILVIGDHVSHNGLWRDALSKIRHANMQYANINEIDAKVREYRPTVLMPLEWLRKGGSNGAIRHTLKSNMPIDECQCYVEPSIYGIPAIPSYHPSFLIYNKKLVLSLYYAIDKATSIANGEALPVVTDKILIDPPLCEARDYLNDGLQGGRYPILVGDIETPYASKANGGVEGEDRIYDTNQRWPGSYNIHRVGISHRRGTCLTVPWQPPYVDLLREAISRCDLFVEHADNHYDYRRLRANGVTFTGRIASSMWLWHWYQSDLLKALEFCAPFFFNGPTWKHLSSSQPALYNGKDVCRTFDVWAGCEEALSKEGRMLSFWEHCVSIDEILMKIGRIRLDENALHVFMSRLRAEALEKEKELLSHAPPSSKRIVTRTTPPPPEETSLWRQEERSKQLKKRVKVYPVWVREELNVGSSKQIKDLLTALSIKIPTRQEKDGEIKETTGKKQLTRLAKKTPILHTVLQVRSRKKMVEAYDWTPDPDGYVRTFYGFNPSTWRTSSYHYNLQVVPSRGDLATEFRRALIASPGHLLGEVDSSGIEAVLVGYFAGSERYIRLAKAGVHGWLVSAYLGQPIPLDAPDLAAPCRAFKKSHKRLYDVCKPIIHGSNYMETPYGIYENNPDSFDNPKAAQELQDLYLSTGPGKDVTRWQEHTLSLATKQRYLQNPFGYKHWFHNITTTNSAGDYVINKNGDAKRAIAFLPQSTASAIQRFYLLSLPPDLREYVRLITHDSITIEYPESLGTGPVEQLADIMKQPIPQLGGLDIGVEGKCGYNLADMKVVI